MHDAFGMIRSAALDSKGRLYVADDQVQQISVFDRKGTFLRIIGRRGSGPGEFQAPWLVALDHNDSLFTWDPALARVSVFGPDGTFSRSFSVPAKWHVTAIRFVKSGELLLSAFAAGEAFGLHTLSRNGTRMRSDMPIQTSSGGAGFEASVFGGSFDIRERESVYSQKSPYVLTFFRDGRAIRRCRGADSLTSSPEAVIDRLDAGARLRWGDFKHSSIVTFLDSGLVANTIIRPADASGVVDIVTSECQLLNRRRSEVVISIVFADRKRAVGIRGGDVPQIFVYEIRKGS